MTLAKIEIERPAAPAIVERLAPLVAEARNFRVSDMETDAAAQERSKNLRAGERVITEAFEPARKSADAAKKEILALRDGLIKPLAAARAVYDAASLAYETQERRRAEAEARRLEAEARAAEDARLVAEAQAAAARGDLAAARAALAEEIRVAPVSVPAKVIRVEGMSTRTTWSAEVEDFAALVLHVANELRALRGEALALLLPAMPALNRLAVAQQAGLKIPGVKAVATESRVSRR